MTPTKASRPPGPGRDRPYYSLNDFFLKKFGARTRRVSIDAGFTCPNRDGSLSTGGCAFCGEEGARASYVDPALPVPEQLARGIAEIGRRTGASKFLAYFQAYSNTYAPVEKLRGVFSQALDVPGVVGISVGTRPDCVDAAKLDLLEEIARRKYVLVEYGVQTLNDAVLSRLNRGHGADASVWAITETKKRPGIDVLAHVIFGLPGETKESMLDTVRRLAALGTDAFKFHHLYVEKNTALEKGYLSGSFKVLALDEYCAILAGALALLPPGRVIHRLFGSCGREKLVAPEWTLDKPGALRYLEKYMKDKGIYQGCRAGT